MAPIGGALYDGNSKLWAGPLGVVKLGFRGYDLGKTSAETTLKPEQNIKDIHYQQDGTVASDHVRTGIDYILTATFSEIKTGLIVEMQKGITSVKGVNDSGKIGRSLYQSMRDTEAGVLKTVAVDENGVPSALDEDTEMFYTAIPIVNDNLVQWEADTQRNMQIQFRIKFNLTEEAFGYWGDPTAEGLTAAVWPDVLKPFVLSAEAISATEIEVTFNEDIALQGGTPVDGVVADVDGAMKLGVSVGVATSVLTCTFAAASFASGDVIAITLSDIVVEDTDGTPNTFDGGTFAVTNSVP
jgi:hypothetical protein